MLRGPAGNPFKINFPHGLDKTYKGLCMDCLKFKETDCQCTRGKKRAPPEHAGQRVSQQARALSALEEAFGL